MLVTREEMTLDFGGAKLSPARDAEILRWTLSQFLYGEVTGIQVGQWLYDAPDLDAARFLAKQAIEELQHVGNFLRILHMLGLEPAPAHPVVRFLATGMMGESWAEHVALEMATGEGFVLVALYALADTLDHPEAVAILERAARQEETHVSFGEEQTKKLVAEHPALRRRLLGLCLVWMWGARRIAAHIGRTLPREHPVLSRIPDLLALALGCTEKRLRRMGLVEQPLAELSAATRTALVAEALASKAGSTLVHPLRSLPLVGRRKRLTDTYLDDPRVRALWQAQTDPADVANLQGTASVKMTTDEILALTRDR